MLEEWVFVSHQADARCVHSAALITAHVFIPPRSKMTADLFSFFFFLIFHLIIVIIFYR